MTKYPRPGDLNIRMPDLPMLEGRSLIRILVELYLLKASRCEEDWFLLSLSPWLVDGGLLCGLPLHVSVSQCPLLIRTPDIWHEA